MWGGTRCHRDVFEGRIAPSGKPMRFATNLWLLDHASVGGVETYQKTNETHRRKWIPDDW